MLCDLAWLDPDMKVSNGISATEQRDMLRLDAMIMMVQMNIRKLIDVSRWNIGMRPVHRLGFWPSKVTATCVRLQHVLNCLLLAARCLV